jgi:hypothetical protein
LYPGLATLATAISGLRNVKLIFILFFAIGLAQSDLCLGVSSVPFSEEPEGPWFTGPLLTPSARVMPPGHVNLEPYLFWDVATGKYDDHWKAHTIPTFNTINPQLQVKYGLVDKIDLTATIMSFYKFTQGKSGSSFGDLFVGLEYQLFEGKPHDWITFAKFSIIEGFPTGKYQHLDPDRLLTDAGGEGSYITAAGLTLSKLFEFPCKKYLGTRCNFSVLYFTPTHIRGLSVFGGDPFTRGTVHHGATYLFFAGAEYTVTREFTLACDFFARYVQRKTFRGFSVTPISLPEQIQFSLAPAVEYNWSDSMGIIVGAWFSFTGRNAARFINGVAAFNYVY